MATPVALVGELTIAQAASQREVLLAALARCEGPLTLDLSAVEAFDSAGVQLLLATRASMAERGQPLMLHAPAPPVTQALQVFGLQQMLSDPQGTMG